MDDNIGRQLALAFSQFDQGNLAASQALYASLLDRVETLSLPQQRTLYMGLMYVSCGAQRFDLALTYAEKLLDISPAFEDRHIALHQTAMVQRLRGSHSKALALLEQEHTLIAAHGGNPMKFAVNLYEVGMLALLNNDPAKALHTLEEALGYARSAADPMTLGCVHRALGEAHTAMGEPGLAAEELNRALALFGAAGDAIACSEVQAMMDAL